MNSHFRSIYLARQFKRMTDENTLHTFHIPVMGTGYTIDSPIKVARYGINSVVSIIDDQLMELMRKHYCRQFGKPYESIGKQKRDHRALRITAYLDLMDEIVREQFDVIRNEAFEPASEITKYFELLPDSSALRQLYDKMLSTTGAEREALQTQLRERMKVGTIDVNIMTKIDRTQIGADGESLPVEYNDAHAALRGYALSRLASSVVLSAGLNPKLYGYIAEFSNFLPDKNGYIKKKLILKVSDYRSALIQGKFLAKKGLWISEFRVESGLNCGGHAFATEGQLLGPIMHEFSVGRKELIQTLFELYAQALLDKGLPVPIEAPAIAYSVQGGVGDSGEHQFLLSTYGVHSVGWGSPFLLVPEAVNIDPVTLEKLCNAGEEDLYLSDISPLGVPFNSLKGSSAELERLARIEAGRPGSPCYKEHLSSDTEFTNKPICTASRQYQRKKIESLNKTSDPEYLAEDVEAVMQKTCLCVGLANSAMINIQAKLYKGMQGIVICPGPNMAYFNHIVSLREMIDHIYGRTNLLEGINRPHMIIKEMKIYMDYLARKMNESRGEINRKQKAYFQSFRDNLNQCMDYYRKLISGAPEHFAHQQKKLIAEIQELRSHLLAIPIESIA